ncbi:hypothetical protein LO762_00610 [Actinocorallia sp. API 0066]|uniref:hypothetical protein n=1 Tax=Actinocorallia sp. API 0066 TaxID=2896846 RepID=UPI001E3B54E1|nr:hypothetical protein [Actinocorallia sp. API 0066]MCD0447703.1 hypothetical protein [Actinocorallia sp. API 0066]
MFQPSRGARRKAGRRSTRSAFGVVAAVGAGAVLVLVIAAALLHDEPPPPAAPRTDPASASGGGPPRGVFPRAFAGTWRGALATDDGGWEVQLALPLGEGTGSVRYYQHGALECRGTVRHLAQRRTVLRLEERTPNCDPNKSGIVRLTVEGDRLRHAWFADADDLAQDAPSFHGVLDRVG